MVNLKRIRSLLSRKSNIPENPSQVEHKKWSFNPSGWRLSKRAKAQMAVVLISVILVSFIAFLPKENQAPQNSDVPIAETNTPQPNNNTQSNPLENLGNIISDAIAQASTTKTPGIIESAKTIDNSTWRAIAAAAWQYYKPGIGVDSITGLPWSSSGSPYITDWDVGVYIQAVIDARKLDLIGDNGTWGFNDRIDKVLSWLETRELNNASYPYWFYQATDRGVWHEKSDEATSNVDIVDTGHLFVALGNLRDYKANYTSRINDIVLSGRSNYAALVPSIKAESGSTSIYGYYYVSGFASFWPELSNVANQILTNILSADTVTMDGGVQLHKSAITGDVLLSSVFDLYNRDHRIMTLADQVYAAHEAYYNVTREIPGMTGFRAFGEGPNFTPDWQWGWVITPDGQTWKSLNSTGQETGQSPLIYTKIAFGFLAIYNTSYARSMCIYLEQHLDAPEKGYGHGVDEAGAAFNTVSIHTNGLILSAALYYIEHNHN